MTAMNKTAFKRVDRREARVMMVPANSRPCRWINRQA